MNKYLNLLNKPYIMNTGKYFESQFVKSFHSLCKIEDGWFLIRLKDIGFVKNSDVGDYIVFYKDKSFAVELKARKNGVIYPSDLKTDYMIKQLEKWQSFNYPPNRKSIYIIKNEKTKELGIFDVDSLKIELLKNEIKEENAPVKVKYNNSDIPYDIKSIFNS